MRVYCEGWGCFGLVQWNYIDRHGSLNILIRFVESGMTEERNACDFHRFLDLRQRMAKLLESLCACDSLGVLGSVRERDTIVEELSTMPKSPRPL